VASDVFAVVPGAPRRTGVLLLGLGMNLAEIKKIRVASMLPSLIIVVILSHYFL